MIQISNKADDLRVVSRRRLLSAVRHSPGLAQGELAGVTALGAGTVSAIVSELVDSGALARTEVKNAGRGRPKVNLSFNPSFRYSLLFRTATHEVEGSLVDYQGTLKDRLYSRRAVGDAFRFDSQIASMTEQFLERNNFDYSQLGLVSVTVKSVHGPQVKDPAREALTSQALARSLNMSPTQVKVAHEQALVAYGVLKARPKHEYIAVLSLGNVVSLAIAQRTDSGELKLHSPNFAHSMSHPFGAICHCGKQGCVEAYASSYGLLRAALGGPNDKVATDFVPVDQLNQIAEQASSGSFRARQGFVLGGEALGRGLGQVMNMWQPMPVWIMGQGSSYLDLLMPTIRLTLEQVTSKAIADDIQLHPLPQADQTVFESNLSSVLDTLDRMLCEDLLIGIR